MYLHNSRFHEAPGPTEYRVEIEINGEIQHFEGTIGGKRETGLASETTILEFDYDPAQRKPEDPAVLTTGPYANYSDEVILRQWQSVLPAAHILEIEDPRAIVDVMLGVLAIVGGGSDLDGFIADMQGREQLDLRQDQAVQALGALASATRMSRASVHGEVVADRPGEVIFEGAQGVLLDAELGSWPRVTPSRTGPAPAEALLAEAGAARPLRLEVLRAYATRHGPGPLVSESAELTQRLPEWHNRAGEWQGPMRVGCFDLLATRHALELIGGVDGLVFTCLDRLAGLAPLSICTGYRAPDGALTRRLSAPPTDRRARGERSAALLDCRPELREVDGWRDVGIPPGAVQYARSLADALAHPLAGLAAGATVADRVWAPSTDPTAA